MLSIYVQWYLIRCNCGKRVYSINQNQFFKLSFSSQINAELVLIDSFFIDSNLKPSLRTHNPSLSRKADLLLLGCITLRTIPGAGFNWKLQWWLKDGYISFNQPVSYQVNGNILPPFSHQWFLYKFNQILLMCS